MDGVHIDLTAPLEQPQRFANRHGCHSVLVQAVCDHNLLHRDEYVGDPGSIGDRRMFDRSPLSTNLLLRPDMLSRGEHILADGAYALTEQVMVPYIRDRNTPQQNTHNSILSSARSSVERSFALLKGKNRRHKKLPVRNHRIAIDHITSGFVLDNFIVLEGQEAAGLPSEEMPIFEDEDEMDAVVERSRAAGAIKREYVAHLLHG